MREVFSRNMSTNEINLCSCILKEYHGPVAEKVGVYLLKKGAMPLRVIAQDLSLKLSQVGDITALIASFYFYCIFLSCDKIGRAGSMPMPQWGNPAGTTRSPVQANGISTTDSASVPPLVSGTMPTRHFVNILKVGRLSQKLFLA